MKKILLIFLTTFVILTEVIMPTHAFINKKDKPVIIFRSQPISQSNIMTPETEFARGERIYYLVTMPVMQYSRKLYIQVVKLDNEIMQTGFNLEWTRFVKLKDEEINQFTDYVVLNRAGMYRMKVYSQDKPTKLYATADFLVK